MPTKAIITLKQKVFLPVKEIGHLTRSWVQFRAMEHYMLSVSPFAPLKTSLPRETVISGTTTNPHFRGHYVTWFLTGIV